MNSVSKNELVNELLEKLGQLFGMRVAEYHRKHISQIDFFNQFMLVIPEEVSDDTSLLKYIAKRQSHFVTHLGIDVFDLEFDAIALSQTKDIQYSFTIGFEVPDVNDEIVFVQFRLLEKQMFINDPDSLVELERFGDEKISALIQKLKHEISFGSLKR